MKFFKYLIQVHMQIELQTTVKFKQTKPEYIWKEQLRIITLTWQGLIGLLLRRISPLSFFFLSHKYQTIEYSTKDPLMKVFWSMNL